MNNQSIIHRILRGIGRRTLVFALTTMMLFSGFKSAEAEPITLGTVAAAVSLISLAIQMFDSGTDPTAVAVLQTRTTVDEIHKRLNAYDTAIVTLLAHQVYIRRQIRYDLEREFKNENLRVVNSAMREVVEYYNVYNNLPTPHGEGHDVFSHLDRSVNIMMERDDLYVADYVIAMVMVLDTIFRSGMEKKLQRKKLDETLARYVMRLERVLNVNLEASLAFRARNLKIGLCEEGTRYLRAELKEDGGNKEFAEQIQFFELIEYLLDYGEYALVKFKYGPWSSNPDQGLILDKPEISIEDDYNALIDRFFSLRYLYWCLESDPAPILIIDSR